MIQKSTLDFLRKLKKNNNKAWMDANRLLFENAKEDFKALVASVINEIGKFDKDISALEPKHCIFRQNRDIRFSKDKSPYKLAFGAFMSKSGKKSPFAGYYIHIEPGNCFLAAGCWMPEKEMLASIRQEIDYNIEEFAAILKNKSFKKFFPEGLDQASALSRPPKGYDDNNKALPYLKLKSFTISMAMEEEEVQVKGCSKKIAIAFQSAYPLVKFLNQSVD